MQVDVHRCQFDSGETFENKSDYFYVLESQVENLKGI